VLRGIEAVRLEQRGEALLRGAARGRARQQPVEEPLHHAAHLGLFPAGRAEQIEFGLFRWRELAGAARSRPGTRSA